MSQKDYSLEDLLSEGSLSEDRLDELNVGKFFRKVGSAVKTWLESIQDKVLQFISKRIKGKILNFSYQRIRNRNYVYYTQKGPKGRLYGFLYPSVVKDSIKGSQKPTTRNLTMCKVYAKGKQVKKPNHLVMAFDKQFLSNTKKSNTAIQQTKNESLDFFGKLSSELLDEAAPRGGSFLRKQTSSGSAERAADLGYSSATKASDMPIPSDEDILDNPDLEEYLSTAKVGPEIIADILSEFITAVAFREEGDDVPSLLIQGFPGGGKTSIVKAFAKARFQVHVLEVASLFKEILGGFPTIENGLEMNQEEIDKNVEAIQNGKKEMHRVERDVETGKAKRVVMRPADIFPEEDGRVHVFFLDEYNRDSEKMAASMNLLLSGSIGSQYTLPKRTIVVAAGNLGEDIDKVSVQRLDNATFDRFSSAVLMQRDVVAGQEFTGRETDYTGKGIEKGKPDEKFDVQIPYISPEEQREFAEDDQYGLKLGGSITSMDMFISKMAEKYGVELLGPGWEKELSIKPLEFEYISDEDDIDEDDVYLVTPRKLERINKRVKDRVVRDWIEAKKGAGQLVDPSEIAREFPAQAKKYRDLETPEDWEQMWEKDKQNYISKGIPSPVALYLHVAQWHYWYLPTVLKQVLGGNPGSMITTIRKTVQEAIKEANQITPNDIIFGYAPKRIAYGHTITKGKNTRTLEPDDFVDKVKQLTTVPDNVMRQLVTVLAENASEAKLKQRIKEVTGKDFETIQSDLSEKKVKVKNAKSLIAINLHLFISNIDLSVDRVATLVYRMKEYGLELTGDQEVEETEAQEKINKQAKDLVAYVYGALVKKNSVFKESRLIKAGADLEELDAEEEKKKNEEVNTFFSSGFNKIFEAME